MSLPEAVTTITVTGEYQSIVGAAAGGSVTFTPSATPLIDSSDAIFFEATPVIAPITGSAGVLSVVLPTTDQFSPADWTYLVSENITFGSKQAFTRTYYVALPSTLGDSVNLIALAPLSTAPATFGYLPTSGGTITGPLILAGNPTVPLGAATKQYADAETTRAEAAEGVNAAAIAAETTRAEAAEALRATASGLTAETVRAEAAEGVNATAISAETTRAEAAEALRLPLAGGTVVGPLAVTGELTAAGFELPLLGPSHPVPYRTASAIKTMFQSGHGWTTSGTGVGSSSLNDTSTFIRGTQCATVTTAGNGIQAALSLTGATAVDLTGKMIRLTFKVDDITHLATLAFYVGSSSFGSNFLWNYFTSTPGSLNYVQSGEWITVCLSWADIVGSATYTVSAAGVPSTKSGFTDMRLAIYDDAAGTATIHYQSVEIVPDTSATFPNGLVSITFDDSYQSVYDLARPVMDPYGYTATLMTIADQVGQSGRLTLPEMRSLQNFSGWEVAGHAYTTAAHNAGYNTLTAAAVNAELRNMKAWLVSNGFTGDAFAYPSGEFAATTDSVPVDQLAGRYFATGRTVISELNEVWPPPMPLRTKALTGVSSASGGVPVSTVTATGGVLERCAQQGAWLQLSLHQIVASGVTVTTQLLQSDLSTLLAAVNSYGMTVLPVSAVTRRYS